jgi:hypothetical protein
MSHLDDLQKTQTITKETVEYLRQLKEQKISTGRITAKVVERVREEWANQIAYHEKKIEEHDHILLGLAKSFSHVTGFLGKMTGKK